MAKYYFTYGLDDEKQAFRGGWTEVEAANRNMAYAAYKAFHPANENGFLPFCACYDEKDFVESVMNTPAGNFGKRCHERICLSRELIGGNKQ